MRASNRRIRARRGVRWQPLPAALATPVAHEAAVDPAHVARLREQCEQLELVLEGTRLGFWDWYPQTNEVRFSPRWAEMLGYRLDEITPSLESWSTRVHPEDIDACYADIAAHVEGRSVYYENVHRVLHKDGHWVHILDRGMIVSRDAEGKPLRFCGTHTDITAQREAERLAVEATRAKTRFLANMSHELRTPLTAVLGLSGALRERTFGDLNDEQDRLLGTIEESGRHLLDLINDMLDLSRIEIGRLSIDTMDLSVVTVVRQAVALVADAARAKAQEVSITFDPRAVNVHADPKRLKQILLNLLVNASKFGPPSSTIRVATSLSPDDKTIAFAVADDGNGIDPEDHARIFEPFVVLEDGLDRTRDGTGLGLALVRRLTELHAGTVTVESRMGQGARFIVELPARENVSDVGMPRAPVSRRYDRADGRGRRVLLVEDDAVNVLVISSYLRARGFEVVVARDGATGVTASRDASIAAILMDVQLPVVDGLEAMRRIREHRDEVPIVVLTAFAMPADAERCIDAGADAYLSKPVDLPELVRALLILIDDEEDDV